MDPVAHDAIWAAVQEWQAENDKRVCDRPEHGAWQWDLRCTLAQKELLTREHCWGVCRIIVRDMIKRMQTEGEGVD